MSTSENIEIAKLVFNCLNLISKFYLESKKKTPVKRKGSSNELEEVSELALELELAKRRSGRCNVNTIEQFKKDKDDEEDKQGRKKLKTELDSSTPKTVDKVKSSKNEFSSYSCSEEDYEMLNLNIEVINKSFKNLVKIFEKVTSVENKFILFFEIVKAMSELNDEISISKFNVKNLLSPRFSDNLSLNKIVI
jgi:membrane-associated HD superfamily phosphohydrolase